MSGCEPREEYLALLASAGFERVSCSGPTNFATSTTTLGFDFVAHKPSRRAEPAASHRAALVAVAAAVALVGVAVMAFRRRS